LPVNIIPDVAQLIQMCTRKTPRERPAATELLDLPWVSQELMAYNRLCGPMGKLSMAAIDQRESQSMPRLPSVTKSTAKMILSRPNLRMREKPMIRAGKLFVNVPETGD
jgi:hypothetical protein